MGEAASKWSNDAVFNNEKTAAMAVMIDNYVPIDNPDLKEIVALLADLDLENCFEHPMATYMSEAYTYLAKKGKDPDAPSHSEMQSQVEKLTFGMMPWMRKLIT